jgi:hypothetical protein
VKSGGRNLRSQSADDCESYESLDEYEQLISPVRECFAISPKVQAINSSSNAVFLKSILLHFCARGVAKDRILIAALGAARSCRKSGEANGTLPLDFVTRRVNNHHPGRHQAKVSRVVRLHWQQETEPLRCPAKL